MISPKLTLPALALAAALAGYGALPAPQAAAQAGPGQPAAPQQQAAPQQPSAPAPERRGRFDAARHVEGRIAYLKTELKITDAQQPQFDKFAAAMRENAQQAAQAAQQLRAQRGQSENAADRLATRAHFAALRAQADQRLADAFRPLYDSLSPDQKKTADELMAPHRHHRRGP